MNVACMTEGLEDQKQNLHTETELLLQRMDGSVVVEVY
jgi:hypothetical protein